MELAPGEQKRVALAVKPKGGKLFGPTLNRPFRVEARQGAKESPTTAEGQLIIAPPLQPYKLPMIAVLLLLVLGGLALAAMTLLGGGDDEKPASSESPTAAATVATQAAQPTATPAGLFVGRAAVIANSDPVPNNTNYRKQKRKFISNQLSSRAKRTKQSKLRRACPTCHQYTNYAQR